MSKECATVRGAMRKHGLSAREAVAFIRGRHCSRVSLTSSLSSALWKAYDYGVEENEIAGDIEYVAAFNALRDYVRDAMPYRRVAL